MLNTYQLSNIVNRVIDKLKTTIKVKGTDNEEFRQYQIIFNSLSRADRKFIVRYIMASRGRLVRFGIDNKEDVHLEGLGTFKYKEDRNYFIKKFRETLTGMGYERMNEVPKEVKFKVTGDINTKMNSMRIDNYFAKLEKNRAKRFVPTAISLNLNIK